MLDEIFGGIAAAGTLVTAAAVTVGVWQLRATERELELSREQARTGFEDDLSREYRTIIGELPPEAFYEGQELRLTSETRRAFYRYFDLSNEQLFHVRNGRVSAATAEQWRDGISGNLRLPSFKSAWRDLRLHLPRDLFEDFRPLADAALGDADAATAEAARAPGVEELLPSSDG